MISVTLQEAKARLNQLVEQARAGEDVVLMRGSEIVARIQPLGAADVEIAPHLADQAAERFWAEIAAEDTTHFRSAKAAAASLKQQSRRK